MNNHEAPASNQKDNASRANEAEWIARARAGDEEAFGEIVRAYHDRVYGVIYRMVNNAEDARELAQQAWVKAWQKLGSYKGDARFFTWLYRVAINTVLDETRRAARRREVSLDETPGREPIPASEWHVPDDGQPDVRLARDEIWTAFEKALQQLSPEHRAALILREVEGLSYKEIAEAMNCRTGTVMSRIFYARREMQKMLKNLI